ncbi:MAG: regulatory protein RecX [Acidobacteriota bacterium]
MTREKPPAYEQAVRLLGTRPHFRRELEQKLAARAYEDAEVAPALDRLAGAGYLDDFSTARSFVAQRLARGAEGKLKLKAELERRGASSAAVAAALAEIPDDDLEPARQAAAKWSRRGKTDPAALARHLAAKGFSRRAIGAVIAAGGWDETFDLDS